LTRHALAQQFLWREYITLTLAEDATRRQFHDVRGVRNITLMPSGDGFDVAHPETQNACAADRRPCETARGTTNGKKKAEPKLRLDAF